MTKRPLVPEAKTKLDKMKMEVADELGLHTDKNQKDTDLGNITTREAGKMAGFKNVGNVGGEMVRRMIAESERRMAEIENNKKS